MYISQREYFAQHLTSSHSQLSLGLYRTNIILCLFCFVLQQQFKTRCCAVGGYLFSTFLFFVLYFCIFAGCQSTYRVYIYNTVTSSVSSNGFIP